MNKFRIVVDTNIFVSAFRSSFGAANQLIQQLDNNNIEFHLSNSLLLEYEEVLKREADAIGISVVEIDEFLDGLCEIACEQDIAFRLRPLSPDPDDDAVIELAIHAQADYLITYNPKHMRFAEELGVRLVKPNDFLRVIGGK